MAASSAVVGTKRHHGLRPGGDGGGGGGEEGGNREGVDNGVEWRRSSICVILANEMHAGYISCERIVNGSVYCR